MAIGDINACQQCLGCQNKFDKVRALTLFWSHSDRRFPYLGISVIVIVHERRWRLLSLSPVFFRPGILLMLVARV